MSLVDFILNIAGVLLWLSWRSARQDPLGKARPTTLAGTLRRAEAPRLARWYFPAVLAALLVLRAFFYRELGPAVDWNARLPLGVIAPYFRSDFLVCMLLFSLLSFSMTLGAFYLWLLLLSTVKAQSVETDTIQKLIGLSLGRLERLPRAAKSLLPFAVIVALWLALAPLLVHLQILPRALSVVRRAEEGALIALWSYLSWRYVIGILLGLYLVQSYVYLGKSPFWTSINQTARQLLAPLQSVPLRFGKVDFAPVVAIVLMFAFGVLAEAGLRKLYVALPT